MYLLIIPLLLRARTQNFTFPAAPTCGLRYPGGSQPSYVLSVLTMRDTASFARRDAAGSKEKTRERMRQARAENERDFLRQAMLRALWLQAVSVTRECRRFADVFQSEELFDHALHTQTETAMRWQAVFVHS